MKSVSLASHNSPSEYLGVEFEKPVFLTRVVCMLTDYSPKYLLSTDETLNPGKHALVGYLKKVKPLYGVW